jgi:HlyD family secretion protein
MANIDQADIGLVEQAKSVKFSVDAFPGKDFDGKIQQMRLNPQNVQNVVTYNVVIDVSNPEQQLKPGMTANLIITIDERNNVLKVPNAALRFIPQGATGQQSGNATGAGNSNEQTRRQQQSGNTNGASDSTSGNSLSQQGNGNEPRLAPATAPVLAGQTRLVWVLGKDSKPQSRRIKVGLNDGTQTEVVEGNLQEGEMVIIGQTISSTSTAQSSPTPASAFGGAQRTGVPVGSRR